MNIVLNIGLKSHQVYRGWKSKAEKSKTRNEGIKLMQTKLKSIQNGPFGWGELQRVLIQNQVPQANI